MNFKPTRIRASLLLLAGGLLATTVFQSNSSGITGRSVVGCGGGGCHSNAANPATAITLIGPTGGYTPGQTYTIGLGVSNATQNKAGFDLTVSAGTLSNAGTGMAINGNEARHTTPATMTSGNAGWSFSWTAPAAGSGTVTVNVASNAVNGNGNADNGDQWNTTSFTFTEAAGPTGPTVTTQAATAITATGATLNGQANANGGTYGVGFQLGTSTSYGTNIFGSPITVSGSASTNVTGTASGLMPATLYHFRMVAVDFSSDTTFGSDLTFTTLNSASVSTVQSAGIRFYPNPATDRMMVDVRNTAMDVREVRVADMTGRVLNVSSTKTAAGFEIQTASLPAGQYHLLIADQNGKLLASTFTKR